ncbi:MAG: sulfatase-like hydrolase/transferase, partial [Bacteroidota bacterium]
MYHKLILTFSIACSVLGNIALAQKNKHPNILWVITDEHNFRTLGCYRDLLPQDQALMWGEPVVATPNIDRLAAQGAIFDRMYASSPVCSPNRASMFTGEYPHTVNVATNDRVMDVNYPTIATVLKENGYRTGYAGKWHLSGEAKPGWQPNPNY